MIWFIFFCIIALIALLVGLFAFATRNNNNFESGNIGFVGGIIAFVAVIFLFFSLFTTVPTKTLAVETTFGRPTGSLTNGFHWKAPWENTTELNAAVQTNTYATDGGIGGDQQRAARGTCVNIRLASQANACVNVSIRWQMREDGVEYLFQNFRDNDGITDELVLRDLQTSMNNAFASYNPLAFDETGVSANPTLSGNNNSYSAQVLKAMQAQIGKWIDVQAINIPIVYFDNGTQDRINAIQGQIQQTLQAKEKLKTNEAQAAANAAIAASVSNSPGVLQSRCLDIVADAVDKGRQLPAGFTCFGSGSDLAIAVPAQQ